MADIVVDTNVIVGYLDRQDTLHGRASAVFEQLEASGDRAELLSFLVAEAVSVLARRSVERRTAPPEVPSVLAAVHSWRERDEITFVEGDERSLFDAALGVVSESKGGINFNDALVIVLQQQGLIGEVVTFDARLAAFPGLRCRFPS